MTYEKHKIFYKISTILRNTTIYFCICWWSNYVKIKYYVVLIEKHYAGRDLGEKKLTLWLEK